MQSLRLPSGSVFFFLHVFDLKKWPDWPLFGSAQQFQEKLGSLRKKATAKARRFINRTADSFRGQRRLEVRTNVVEGIPGAEILAAIKENSNDLVVVGSKGLSGMKRFLLGSVSEWVLSDAPCSVLVVRGQPRWTRPKARGMRVLLATDGSHDSKRAVTFFKHLTLPKSTQLTILHVLEPCATPTAHVGMAQLTETMRRKGEKAGERLLQETKRGLGRRKFVVESKMTEGHPAEEILKAIKRTGADLVVVGSQGLTGLRRFLLGSVAHKVARHAPCSVLVVRQSHPKGKSQKKK